jgi:hypothetical protein
VQAGHPNKPFFQETREADKEHYKRELAAYQQRLEELERAQYEEEDEEDTNERDKISWKNMNITCKKWINFAQNCCHP